MADEDGTENKLCQAYCLLYKFNVDNKKWDQLHRSWIQVNLYEDTADDTFRVVAWSLPEDPNAETEILLNSNVTHMCSYSRKREDFLKYTDDERTYGFGFFNEENNTSERSPEKSETNTFIEIFTKLIDRRRKEAGIIDEAITATEGANTVKFVKLNQKAGDDLHIEAAAPTKDRGDGKITEPTAIKHMSHVKFDPLTRTYVGLPKEWENSLNQQFGLEISRLECQKVEGYKSRIPSVLVQMYDYLKKEKAFEVEGIFRIAADGEECNFVKTELNKNSFTKCEDLHCIATLLKVWFRDLPRPILDSISTYNIVECDTPDKAGEIVAVKMQEPEGSVMMWLVDVLLDCTVKSRVNKMTPTNLGIVFGPNLFRPNMMDPMASLQYSQKVAGFLGKAIVWRGKQKGQDVADTVAREATGIQKTF